MAEVHVTMLGDGHKIQSGLDTGQLGKVAGIVCL